MQDYEAFVEISVEEAANLTEEQLTEIANMIMASYPGYGCKYSDSGITKNSIGRWTIGIVDSYVDELRELAAEFKGITFIARAITNDEAEFYDVTDTGELVENVRAIPLK